MTALLLTFAVHRLFDCFLFNFYFSLLCETPAPRFEFSPTPHSVPGRNVCTKCYVYLSSFVFFFPSFFFYGVVFARGCQSDAC